MKLSESVAEYVLRRKATGIYFEKGEELLIAFARIVGDVQLVQVDTKDVLKYLNAGKWSNNTWRLRHQMLFRFFDFWATRGAMPEVLMPPLKPLTRRAFIPYIYTRAELRALLRATKQKNPLRNLEPQTLRTFVLLLYATGALAGEILRLRLHDVNLDAGTIDIKNERQPSRSRKLPIGLDLREALRSYIKWRSRRGFRNDRLLVTKDDLQVTNNRVVCAFETIRMIAGVARHNGETQQPRLHDLKATFAVHRITSWIRNDADLNRMLPALAAYMGLVTLGSTERYLHMTPERFRKDLNKLSPMKGTGRWRNNKELMTFLANV